VPIFFILVRGAFKGGGAKSAPPAAPVETL
jgi:hypothetical protein